VTLDVGLRKKSTKKNKNKNFFFAQRGLGRLEFMSLKKNFIFGLSNFRPDFDRKKNQLNKFFIFIYFLLSVVWDA
jgi:hypothetical protein